MENVRRGPVDRLRDWFDENFQATERVRFLLYVPVPLHATRFWYCFGGLTLFFIINQLITGIVLTFYYTPSISTAYSSVYYISQELSYGWLIRSLHYWGAQLVMVFLILHLLRILYTKAYANPRQLTWITGVFQFAIMMLLAWSGYILPWHETAYWAGQVGTNLMNELPIVGPFIRLVFIGGTQIGQNTLSHLFDLHVFVLPVALLALLGGHFYMIRRQHISGPV